MSQSQPKNTIDQKQVGDALLRVGHDRYFKAIMELPDISTEFFTQHLPPALLNQLDLKTLQLEKESFIRDSLKRKEADILFSVQKTNGVLGYVHLVFEHLSSPEDDLPFRMHKYAIDIMDGHRRQHKTKKLPFVYPIVLYTGARPYKHSLDFFDMFEKEDRALAREYIFQPLMLVDLTHIEDEMLKKKYDWLELAAFLAKAIHRPNVVSQLPEIMKIARTMRLRDAWTYVVLSIAYLFSKCTIEDQEVYNKIMDDVYLASEEGDLMKTIAEYVRQDGIQAGILLGRQEEKQENERETVQKMYMNGASIDTIVQLLDVAEEKAQAYVALITKN